MKKTSLISAISKITLLSVMAMAGFEGTAHAATLGGDQVILFKTSPSVPSHCIMRNSQDTTSIPTTPYRMPIPKGISKLEVECTSNDGLYRGKYEYKAKFNANALVSAPWEAFQMANEVASDFEETGDQVFGTMMKYPSTIVIPMTNTIQTLPDAKYGTQEDAIANAPVDNTPVETTPVKPVKKHVVKHIVKHHTRPATSADVEGKS